MTLVMHWHAGGRVAATGLRRLCRALHLLMDNPSPYAANQSPGEQSCSSSDLDGAHCSLATREMSIQLMKRETACRRPAARPGEPP